MSRRICEEEDVKETMRRGWESCAGVILLESTTVIDPDSSASKLGIDEQKMSSKSCESLPVHITD